VAKENKDKLKIISSNLFPVIGVGASAGGLEAFRRLLRAIPENSGMAYILVQHLDPTHESILTELLQKVTKIPVQEISDNVHVEPDHIYIIPANKLLTATDGVLQLSARPPKNYKNMPIDLFFTSLAAVHQDHAIGVVLSGTATDGTLGLTAIKNSGGVTFAQEQQSAAYDGMPQSAIDAGVVDFILPPEEIPLQLSILRDKTTGNNAIEGGDKEQLSQNEFKQIMALLRTRKGVDFTYYKQPTIRRRVERRIALSRTETMGEYLLLLKESKPEQDDLYQDLLIPVTQFFRDPKTFEKISDVVLPALLKDRSGNEPLRIWVAGCSTGEEAYTMAICIQECLTSMAKSSTPVVQIFATDISDIAITKARAAVYSKKEVSGLSAARLQQFFTSTDGMFRLNKSLRDTCVFAYHNYLKDPPFAKIDLISCRNSLIYLEPFLQKKALTTFHYALNEKGVLLLGKSETPGQATELYNNIDKTNKIYSRKAVRGNFLHVIGDRREETSKTGNNSVRNAIENNKDDFQKSADSIILTGYVPPGVIVNEEMDIVQFRGATGAWLEASPGKPSLNVLKMSRKGLAFELRNSLHKVNKNNKALIKENIPIEFEGKERLVTIEVIPLPDTIERYFLILFRDTSIVPDIRKQTNKNGQGAKANPELDKERSRNGELSEELAQVRADMTSITEAQEAANEELQSANEELLSGSEELQSLNEELETSKEEVQTSNEELIIVNQELYDRGEQLDLSRLYAESIITTIREPLMVLTQELKVRSANRAFYEKFQVIKEGTEGKFLFDLGNRQWDIPGLREALEKVLPQQTSMLDFEVARNFPELGERVMILNASRIIRDHKDEPSILLAIEDVTERRRIETIAKLETEELEQKVLERTFSLHEANIDLKLSNESLEQFAYIASHDLQEPLRKIRTFLSLLQEKYSQDLPEAAKVLIVKVNSSAQRMSTLIQGVLNFSKILHGKINFEQTDLNLVLNTVLTDFDLLITENKAVIRRKPLPVIDAMPVLINQLFYNLISNSFKFAKKGINPIITITSRLLTITEMAKHPNIDPSVSYCEICFKDNGIGFQQKNADQIFQIFHRLHSEAFYSGTGIGLALCKEIVTNHRGEISATSAPGEGALFQIILPLIQKPPMAH
jgi:two-component system, chemotaxis family, CheB/CheR fusion protein